MWEKLSDHQAKQFPGLPKRRKAEYKMFNEGIYVNVYTDNPTEYEFPSSNPFTDLINGKF